MSSDKFRFKSVDSIGAADARQDRVFLDDCFVDTGDLAVLSNSDDARRLILGRTGAGKSALLLRLAEQQNCIEIEPESLALSYISSSTILSNLVQLGVKLDNFFCLLWRHVFALEAIKWRFHLNNQSALEKFFDTVVPNFFRDRRHHEAIEYFRNWGGTFWGDTEYRIKEVTSKFEADLEAQLNLSYSGLGSRLKSGSKLTEEEKGEVVYHSQRIVNSVQMRELGDMFAVLDHCLDAQKKLFIVIDRLDERWVDDRFRYLLIRALIESVRDFFKVRHLKIIVTLRHDLIDRVFRQTRDPGFQEEKYSSLFLDLKWSKEQLIEVLDNRVDFLIRGKYTGAPVKSSDVIDVRFKSKSQNGIDYIIERTFNRPRDVILFFNTCIAKAVDKPVITNNILFAAEGEYSRSRLRSVHDEWFADYPNLMLFVDLLKNRTARFRAQEMSDIEVNEFCLKLVVNGFEGLDDLSKAAEDLVETRIESSEFRRRIFNVFYVVGLVGLKMERTESYIWSFQGPRAVSLAEINDEVRVAIHATFWRVLGIREAEKELGPAS